VVYSFHPSHSVNYNFQDCHKRRTTLYDSIRDACGRVRRTTGAVPVLSPRPLVYVTSNQPVESPSDVNVVRDFMNTLAELCFPPEQSLPVRCVSLRVQPCYYSFTPQQIEFLQHTYLCGPNGSGSKGEALHMLIPLFMKLNGTLTKISYYHPVYTVDVNKVIQILTTKPSNLEQMCLRIVDSENTFVPPGMILNPQDPHIRHQVIQSLARITTTITPLIETRLKVRKVSQQYKYKFPRPVDYQQTTVCRCGSGFRSSEPEIREAFAQAFVPKHYCTACRHVDNHYVVRVWL
jgi:hypothetical protein